MVRTPALNFGKIILKHHPDVKVWPIISYMISFTLTSVYFEYIGTTNRQDGNPDKELDSGDRDGR